jgi:uncharacterized protein YecE (DUF72 family)
MANLLVGTASWTDKTLVDSGLFYPASAKTPQQRLRFYASKFPVTEVDSSYYALPAPQTAQLWVERTPPGFVFDVKAFRLFTGHPTQPKVLPKDIRAALTGEDKNIYYKDTATEIRDELWRLFREALEPLARAGKLGAVLFQFPPWFLPSKAAYEHILACAQMLEGIRISVEFRAQSWFADERRERLLSFLRTHHLVHVVVDEPQGFKSSVPAVWQVTCPELAIVRFHGRNTATWEKKGLASSAERFNYLYAEDELRGLAGHVQDLSAHAATTHALFNNCYRDFGQRNAIDLQRLLPAL